MAETILIFKQNLNTTSPLLQNREIPYTNEDAIVKF